MVRQRLWVLAFVCSACSPAGAGSRSLPEHSRDGQAGPQARVRPSPSPSGQQEALLRAHNQRRAQHCAKPLRWSNELSRAAQRWADKLARGRCTLEHSDTAFGENLAAGTSSAFSPDAIVQMWYRELEDYRFARGSFSMKTGHFTQLVWRSTSMVGCGVSECDGLEVWVCNYDPPGNVDGMFREEVMPSSCRK